MTTKALTVKQPWAALIMGAGKDVENRTWPTPYRGELLIHAGKAFDASVDLSSTRWNSPLDAGLLDVRGEIVGTVQLVDCVRDYPSSWAMDEHWHWILADPQLLDEPVPHRGNLGLWTPKTTVVPRTRTNECSAAARTGSPSR